jgi:ABC-type protease/lipase transport system fused ATPase/permease subunit
MFDDPLSAVDSHVGAHMFSACFLHHLSGTTRILVTHKIEVLHQVDHIICMTDEGSIRCSGSFAEISSKHPEILNHILDSETSQAQHDTAATTAVLPTHKIEVLHQVDHIICMTDEGSIRCSFAEISSKHLEILNHIFASETSQAQRGTAATTDPCLSARGSLTSAENRAQGALSAEVYKFYAAAMGRNYLIAVFLAGALSQVIQSIPLFSLLSLFLTTR